jgi:hypothetical protein
MVVVPAANADNTPLPAIVATAVVLLCHVPPVTELNNEVVPPTQTELPPVMAGKGALTVTTTVVAQPVALL